MRKRNKWRDVINKDGEREVERNGVKEIEWGKKGEGGRKDREKRREVGEDGHPHFLRCCYTPGMCVPVRTAVSVRCTFLSCSRV